MDKIDDSFSLSTFDPSAQQSLRFINSNQHPSDQESLDNTLTDTDTLPTQFTKLLTRSDESLQSLDLQRRSERDNMEEELVGEPVLRSGDEGGEWRGEGSEIG